MAIPLRDLEARYDVKGGSPRSPSGGIPVSEYQAYATNGNNGVWKAIATGLGGLVVGLLVAWFTAFQSKGITGRELQEYVDKYSPYSQQKDVIAAHFATQDVAIGELRGKQERVFDRISKLEGEEDKTNLSLQALSNEVKTKMDIVATYLEQSKAKK